MSKPRPSAGPCAATRGDVDCSPLNALWFYGATGGSSRRYSTCACGRQLRNQSAGPARQRVLELLEEKQEKIDRSLQNEISVWPSTTVSQWSKQGVVPVGTPVLHQATANVDSRWKSVHVLATAMIATMTQDNGVGIAANQIGAGVRVLAHAVTGTAPAVLVNATIHHSSTEVVPSREGCLSVNVPNTTSDVVRSERVVVSASLLDGRLLWLDAGGRLARVLQHEIDHLDGVGYVQRLSAIEHQRVIDELELRGIDPSVYPHLPAL